MIPFCPLYGSAYRREVEVFGDKQSDGILFLVSIFRFAPDPALSQLQTHAHVFRQPAANPKNQLMPLLVNTPCFNSGIRLPAVGGRQLEIGRASCRERV